MPLSSSACHSGSHAGSSSFGSMLAIISVTWRTPPFLTSRCNSASAPAGVSGSIGTPISRSGAAEQNSSSQSL